MSTTLSLQRVLMTQAEYNTFIAANPTYVIPSHYSIFITDATVGTPNLIQGNGTTSPVVSSGGSAAIISHKNWEASTYYEINTVVLATVASGGIAIGDPIRRQTAGTSGATFSATEAGKWAELPEDPDAMLLAGVQTVTGVKTFSTLPELSADATTANQAIRKSQHDTAMALKVAKAGDTMSGVLNVQVNTSTNVAPIISAKHSNLTQGVDVGYNSISASGTIANQDINLIPKGTGSIIVPTKAVGDNTQASASTAFVQAEIAADLATVAPLMDGVAAVGVSTKMAREDHKHPSDTAKMNQYQQGHPFHTAQTQAGHTVTGSSEFSATYAPWTALKETGGDWATAGQPTGNIVYKLPQATIFNRLVAMGRAAGTEYPTTWSLEGSTDGGITFPATIIASHVESLQAEITKDFVNTVAYNAYRLSFTAAVGTNPGISRLRFFHNGINYLPTLPVSTASSITNTPAGSIAATTVQAAINELDTEKAPLASPTFTGVPAMPTAVAGTNTTQGATTAFVKTAVDAKVTDTFVGLETNIAPSKNLVFNSLLDKASTEQASALKQSTVHVANTDLAITEATHAGTEIHLEGTGNLTIAAAAITTDMFGFTVINTDAAATRTITPSGFDGVFLRDGVSAPNDLDGTAISLIENGVYEFTMTLNGGFKYLNIKNLNIGTKQDVLVSGVTVKTVNGASIVGAGNITTSADLDGGVTTTIFNEGLISTGAASVDTTTVAGQTIITYSSVSGTKNFRAPDGVTTVRVLAIAGGGGGGGATRAGTSGAGNAGAGDFGGGRGGNDVGTPIAYAVHTTGATSGAAMNGRANSGGGGGGGAYSVLTSVQNGANGGSGIVIFRYATPSRAYKALQTFADNASAITGGLKAGQFYKLTSTGAVNQVS